MKHVILAILATILLAGCSLSGLDIKSETVDIKVDQASTLVEE